MKMSPADIAQFIERELAPQTPPLTPELTLRLAADYLAIWTASEAQFEAVGLEPPFWAFAWAGGQALGRWILDTPDLVAGKSVLAIGAGAGLEAIAAARAGARRAVVNDLDPAALVAAQMNAALNGVAVQSAQGDLLTPERLVPDGAPAADVILAGDVFYTRELGERAWRALSAAAQGGATVLIGDPDRAYLPTAALRRLASFDVPTPVALEDQTSRRTSVWTPAPQG